MTALIIPHVKTSLLSSFVTQGAQGKKRSTDFQQKRIAQPKGPSNVRGWHWKGKRYTGRKRGWFGEGKATDASTKDGFERLKACERGAAKLKKKRSLSRGRKWIESGINRRNNS